MVVSLTYIKLYVNYLGTLPRNLVPDKYPYFIKKQKKSDFSYVRELGTNICLIGIDSSIEIKTPSIEAFYGNSLGGIYDDQFKELKSILRILDRQEKIILVAIHHHLLDIPKYGRRQAKIFMDRMNGSDKLLRLLMRNGVRIVLNGHIHCPLHIFPSDNCPEILTADSFADPFDGNPKYHLLSIEDGQLFVSTIRL